MSRTLEIERKFILDAYLPPPPSVWVDKFLIFQYYLRSLFTERIRILSPKAGPPTTYYTLKSKGMLSREEYEIQIPHQNAQKILGKYAKSYLVKHRDEFTYKEQKFSIDQFQVPKLPFLLLEVELKSENQKVEFPYFLRVGQEVTFEPGYSSENIAISYGHSL